jgi:glyoxylase-like metal-dependent hydrolase (beta-lactamase superfamily II)
MADYSIWVVEYARVVEFAQGILKYGDWNTGTRVAPYCYAVLKGEGHVAVVDTGYNHVELGEALAQSYGVSDWQPPEVVLKRIGIDPAEVDTMILTHNHFDHAGGVELFPNAHIHIQEREVSHYLWAKTLPDRLQFLTTAVDPDLMLQLVQRMNRGKLTLVEGEAEVLPGVRVWPAFDTHTAGSQYVTVDNDHDGLWLMAGDNMYIYENVTGRGDGRYIPIGFGMGSIEKGLLTTEEMYQRVGGEVRRLVPFHEERMWESFPSQRFDDDLHVAELSIRTGDVSRLSARTPAS